VINRDAAGDPTNPVRLVRAGACNQFGTCNQFGGSPSDFSALIGQLFLQNSLGGLAFTLPEKNLRTPYAQQWHLTVEREILGDFLVSASYVGTKGTKLTRLTTPNLGPNVTPLIPFALDLDQVPFDFPVLFNPLAQNSGFVRYTGMQGLPGQNAYRPDDRLGACQIYANSALSNYHALQLEVRKRYGHGTLIAGSYTWSHAIDDVSDVFPIAGAPAVAQDSFNLQLERGNANFDVRHRFSSYVVWDLPFFRRDKGYLSCLFGGWQIASILQGQTGQPFTLNLSIDANRDGNFSDRPSTTTGLIFSRGHGAQRVAVAPGLTVADFIGDLPEVIPPQCCIDIPGPISARCATLGGGAVGRNIMRGDGYFNLDIALNKTFSLTERQNLEFRSEFFNILNRANFGLPIRTIGAPGFGSSVDTAGPARTIQFALKYRF
jgi:hypothetical protein